jgi:hypothetical protein
MSVVELIEEMEKLSPEDLTKVWEHWGIEPAKPNEALDLASTRVQKAERLLLDLQELAQTPEAEAFAKAWGPDPDAELEIMRKQW